VSAVQVSGESGGAADSGAKVYRVTELLERIRAMVEEEIGYAWVEGEVADFRRPSSGHIYFALKDDRSRLNAAFFRSRQPERVTFGNGDLVRVFGLISVYEGRSEVQVVVEQVLPQGQGALLQRFEELKRKLAEEGLFAPERKKPIPVLPRRIGIVTSPTGAAIRDVFNVLGRRFAGLGVVIAPVRVQGEGAAEEIAEGIRMLNRYGQVDVIIVTRGGGSLDDLWCFNEETVARAIAESAIPVISAVGHEIDYTIADFVADKRAPTPSAAAELVVGRKVDFEEKIRGLAVRMRRALELQAARLRARYERAARSYVFREPGFLVKRWRETMARRREVMRLRMEGALADLRRRVDDAETALRRAEGVFRERLSERLKRLEERLAALDPRAVLARGYSMTLAADGRVLTAAEQVGTGDEVTTILFRGRIRSVVRETAAGPQPGGRRK